MAKVGPNGHVHWLKNLDLLNPSDIQVDALNSVYVVGINYQGNVIDDVVFNNTMIDQFLFRSDSSGTVEWASGVRANKGINFHHLATDDYGNCTVGASWANNALTTAVGKFYPTGSYDLFLYRTDREGQIRWVQTLGSQGEDRWQGLAVNNLGDIAFCGFFYGEILFVDSIALENPDGNPDTFLGVLDGDCSMPEWEMTIQPDTGGSSGLIQLIYPQGGGEDLEVTWFSTDSLHLIGAGNMLSLISSGEYLALIAHPNGCSRMDTIEVPFLVPVMEVVPQTIQVSPNPLKDSPLVMNLPEGWYRIQLFDETGRLGMDQAIMEGGKIELNLGTLRPGRYILVVDDLRNEHRISKLIIVSP